VQGTGRKAQGGKSIEEKEERKEGRGQIDINVKMIDHRT